MRKLLVMSEFKNKSGVDIIERVGVLYNDGVNWIFNYDKTWVERDNSLRLSLQLPLSVETFVSPKLWRVFTERLSAKGGSTYLDYCKRWKVDPESEDWLELLTTVAHRGPSTFVFYPLGFSPGIWPEVTKPRPE